MPDRKVNFSTLTRHQVLVLIKRQLSVLINVREHTGGKTVDEGSVDYHKHANWSGKC